MSTFFRFHTDRYKLVLVWDKCNGDNNNDNNDNSNDDDDVIKRSSRWHVVDKYLSDERHDEKDLRISPQAPTFDPNPALILDSVKGNCGGVRVVGASRLSNGDLSSNTAARKGNRRT